jgi:hypothetical protein
MTVGLAVFIGVVLADVTGLMIDTRLAVWGMPTISAWVRDGHAWAGWIAVAAQGMAAWGLTTHFGFVWSD